MSGANSIQVNKVARYRERLRDAGLRPVQVWLPDTRLPGFAATLQRQCLALKADAIETQEIAFAEAAALTLKGWN